jgi:hypothetical protein
MMLKFSSTVLPAIGSTISALPSGAKSLAARSVYRREILKLLTPGCDKKGTIHKHTKQQESLLVSFRVIRGSCVFARKFAAGSINIRLLGPERR